MRLSRRKHPDLQFRHQVPVFRVEAAGECLLRARGVSTLENREGEEEISQGPNIYHQLVRHEIFVVVIGFERPNEQILASLMGVKPSDTFSGRALQRNCFVFTEFSFHSGQFQPAHPVKGRQGRMGPLVISQDPVDDAATAGDDLHRDSDQPIRLRQKSSRLYPKANHAAASNHFSFVSARRTGCLWGDYDNA